MPYSKSDRRGLILLSVVAVALALGVWVTSKPCAPSANESTVAASDTSMCVVKHAADDVASLVVQDCRELHKFDPNTVDSATLVSFGLRPYKVRTFINYRNAGAIFREPLDIAHVYSLDDADIDLLLPYVDIAPQYRQRRTKYPIVGQGEHVVKAENKHDKAAAAYPASNKFTSKTIVDANTADTTLLQRIPGIGRNIATWIVHHRERLGGFHSRNQLLEVRYVTPEMLEWFVVTADSLHTINLNTAPFAQLSSHPYIGYSRAKAISNRLRLYGPFDNKESVAASGIFPADTLQLLSPYLVY